MRYAAGARQVHSAIATMRQVLDVMRSCDRLLRHSRWYQPFPKRTNSNKYFSRRSVQTMNEAVDGAGYEAKVSHRVLATDAPCIVKTKRLMAESKGAVSLAQGVVHWQPPSHALNKATDLIQSDGSISAYGPDEGLPTLRNNLKAKLVEENGLEGYNLMITSGANQAFVNVVISLCDDSDGIVLFKPYYFNHLMAIQMTGGAKNVVYGQCNTKTMHPDLDWLEGALNGPSPPKLVVVVNPCNPTGVLLSKEELQRLSDMCGKAGAWLVMDNTYEYFVYDGRKHHCISAPHVLHIFSFSKAYGMMGWRVGYLAYPDFDGSDSLGSEILKVQDTIPICPPQLSQHVALGAREAGLNWVTSRIGDLADNRQAVLDALSPLGTLGNGVAGGEGAIYLWAKLPEGCEDDDKVVEWLVKKHGVCLIPGSSCGIPGHIRAAFANLKPEACKEAAGRLKVGLQELTQNGMSVVTNSL